MRSGIIISLVVIGNILWYWIKFTLKENGYSVNWFWGHFNDIPNMFRLAKKTEDKKTRLRYYIMVWALLLSFLSFVGIFTLSDSY